MNFCSQCGAPADDRGRSGTVVLMSAVLGFFLLSTTVAAAWSVLGQGEPRISYGQAGSATAPEGTVPLDAVNPKDIADNLFNHVVDASAAGDSAQLREFLPLALAAYSEAGLLDADGLFHLATLQRIGEMPDAAAQSALRILDIDPDHLLGLGAAAVASVELGRDDQATGYYRRFIDVYAVQVDRQLSEYLGHATFLTGVESEALDRVASH